MRREHETKLAPPMPDSLNRIRPHVIEHLPFRRCSEEIARPLLADDF